MEGDAAGFETDRHQREATGVQRRGLFDALIVNGTVLYVQARGTIIRDIGFDYPSTGIAGTISRSSPHTCLINTRSATGRTSRSHIPSFGWRAATGLSGADLHPGTRGLGLHRHDLGGTVESVCVVPEGTEDALYLGCLSGREANHRANGVTEFQRNRGCRVLGLFP